MTSRKPQATCQPLARSWWMRIVVCLRRGFLFILVVLALLLLFVGLEKWRRHQAVVDKLGNDPIMSKTLLGMRFIKQEIKVDDVLFNWKPTSPELINYFQIDGNQQEVFDKLVKFAKENGWTDGYTSTDGESYYFSGHKDYSTVNIFIKKNEYEVVIERS